jgi:hypothetical protein
VSTLFLTEVHIGHCGAVTLVEIVPKRPQVSAVKFGEWLELQRGERSLEQIARQVREHVAAVGLKFGPPLLYKIEQGRVPSWPVIGALSLVYKVPLVEMLSRLTDAMTFPNSSVLLCHIGTWQRDSRLLEGESAVTAKARIRELQHRAEKAEQERAFYQGIVETAGKLAKDLSATLRQKGVAGARRKTTGAYDATGNEEEALRRTATLISETEQAIVRKTRKPIGNGGKPPAGPEVAPPRRRVHHRIQEKH